MIREISGVGMSGAITPQLVHPIDPMIAIRHVDDPVDEREAGARKDERHNVPGISGSREILFALARSGTRR